MEKRWIIFIGVCIVLFAGLLWWSKSQSDSRKEAAQQKQQAAAPAGKDPSKNYTGNRKSKVELTEFVDFQCEACYTYYPIMKQIEKAYQDRVSFRVRYIAFEGGDHTYSRIAARSAEAAARQGKFWEMQDKLFVNQKTWQVSRDPQAVFDGYAREIGLNMETFARDVSSASVDEMISKDMADAEALGVTGTPSFVLNGALLGDDRRPSPSYDSISALLDAALKKANS